MLSEKMKRKLIAFRTNLKFITTAKSPLNNSIYNLTPPKAVLSNTRMALLLVDHLMVIKP